MNPLEAELVQQVSEAETPELVGPVWRPLHCDHSVAPHCQGQALPEEQVGRPRDGRQADQRAAALHTTQTSVNILQNLSVFI